MIKCEWCGTECANLNSLSQHITNKHNKQGKLYYDTFLLKDVNEKIEWRNGLYEAKHQCMLKNGVIILTKYEDFQSLR